MTVLTFIAAAALATTGGTPSIAAIATSAPVTTRDLDLSTTKGRKTLDLRIARAADMLCHDANARLSASVRGEVRRCRAAAIAAVRARMNATIRVAAR